jgi:hypothetical protein
MRIILEQNNTLTELYWIDIQKSQKNVIIVGSCGADFLKDLNAIAPNLKFEFNFTYPANGNFYYTFKIWSKNDEQIVNVYHDRISVEGTFSKSNLNDWDLLSTDLLRLLSKTVTVQYHRPLKEIESYTFPVISVPIKNGELDLPEIQNPKSTFTIKGKNDLIISPNRFVDGIIELSAEITKNDPDKPRNNWEIHQGLTFEIYDDLFLNLYSTFKPN